jgi:hypothetical protein
MIHNRSLEFNRERFCKLTSSTKKIANTPTKTMFPYSKNQTQTDNTVTVTTKTVTSSNQNSRPKERFATKNVPHGPSQPHQGKQTDAVSSGHPNSQDQ